MISRDRWLIAIKSRRFNLLSSDLKMFSDRFDVRTDTSKRSFIQVWCGKRKSIYNSFYLDGGFGTSVARIGVFGY